MWSAAVSAATTAQTARPLQEYSETCGASCVETKTVSVGGIPYAYRSLGKPSGTPLVMINRFRGTMDEWDPAFLDHVAAGRYVIIFDNGSGAGYVEGANLRPKAIEIATKPVNTDEDFLYLFFKETPTSQAAGREHLARLRLRVDAFSERVSEKAWKAMLSAGSDVGTPDTSLLRRVGSIRQPVLIANGNEDVMIPTYQSYALAQAMPNARLIIYPDSGHAFLFQYPKEFGDEVLGFLETESQP
jgi:pimeloyl-ACP methyl ester carboxylesterase